MNINFTKISTLVLLLGSGPAMAGSMGTVATEAAYNFFIGGTAGIGMLQGKYSGVIPPMLILMMHA